jgi:hypothetical protein
MHVPIRQEPARLDNSPPWGLFRASQPGTVLLTLKLRVDEPAASRDVTPLAPDIEPPSAT